MRIVRARHIVSLVIAATAAVLLSGFDAALRAEDREVRVAKQYGIGYLPLMIMEKDRLIEDEIRQAGLGDVKVTWTTLTSGSDANEALLSKSVDFVAAGVAPLITIWAKTNGHVKSIGALCSMPIYLNTSNPAVKSIKDFTENDRIALPAVKVSIQAVTLQMAASQVFGEANYQKLDQLTVSMAHPEALTALLSGQSEIKAHFTSPPFQYKELEKPGVRTVLNSYDVLGGPASFTVVMASTEYHDKNPKTCGAVAAALEKAMAIINEDKLAAARAYIEASKSKESVDEIYKMIADPLVHFSITPVSITKYADFMHKVGSIKTAPQTWKDLFFTNVHNVAGN